MSYLDYLRFMNGQLLEDLLGRGSGDPDQYGYPNEHEPTCILRVKGGDGRKCDCSYSKEQRNG